MIDTSWLFLFVLGLVWIMIATVHDLKTTFILNWLTFSLIIAGFAYRGFYSVSIGSFLPIFLSLCGFVIFSAMGFVFYYAGMFGGGDVKLLRGIGVILPYANYSDLVKFGALFFILFFVSASVYSLGYVLFYSLKNKKKFTGSL